MAQQIFVSSSNFSAPVMTLDSGDTQKQGEADVVAPHNMALTNIFATFYEMSRLHEQFFVCDNFCFLHKS